MTRLRTTALALLATAAFAGCGDDGPTDPGPTLSLSIVSGNNQVGAIGAALPAPLIVSVEDQSGNAISGESVTWALASAAGPNASVNSSSTTTGTNGQTSVTFTLGDAEGAYEVRASISGSSVTFAAEAMASGVLAIVSGRGQVALTATTLPDSLVVRTVGPGNSPLPDVEVTFAVTQANGAGASVTPTVVTTGETGEAFTRLMLGDRNGMARVTASIEGSSLNFTAYACGGDDTAGVIDHLQPGEGVTLDASEVACVQLPAPQGDASYEVVATTVPQTLGTSNMVLAITGATEQGLAGVSAAGSAPLDQRLRVGETQAAPRLQYEWDRRMRQMETDLLPDIRARAVSGGFALMSVPTVGEQRTIKFSCVGFGGDGTFSDAPEDLTVEAIVVRDRAVIWEDIQNPGAFSQTQYAEIAQTFDDIIYAVDTTYFGAPGDIDGDGRISLVYSSEINRMTDHLAETYSDGFIAGFFCPPDLGAPGFNNAEMFYLVIPDPDGSYISDGSTLSIDLVRRTTDNTVAHEFQHMINAQTGSGGAQSLWINEGLSHLAEEVVGHAVGLAAGFLNFAPGNNLSFGDVSGTEAFDNFYKNNLLNLSVYLSAPADTGGLVLWEDPLTANTFPMRGAAWSFLRYLLDRFEDPALEWQATRSLIRFAANCSPLDFQCSDGSSRGAVEDRFGFSFPDLVVEWNAMLAVDDSPDLGVVPEPRYDLPSWRLRSFFGIYPLQPADEALGTQSTVPAELFTTRARFVRLTGGLGAGVTGLRLMEGISGADLQTGVVPRMSIVRTN